MTEMPLTSAKEPPRRASAGSSAAGRAAAGPSGSSARRQAAVAFAWIEASIEEVGKTPEGEDRLLLARARDALNGVRQVNDPWQAERLAAVLVSWISRSDPSASQAKVLLPIARQLEELTESARARGGGEFNAPLVLGEGLEKRITGRRDLPPREPTTTGREFAAGRVHLGAVDPTRRITPPTVVYGSTVGERRVKPPTPVPVAGPRGGAPNRLALIELREGIRNFLSRDQVVVDPRLRRFLLDGLLPVTTAMAQGGELRDTLPGLLRAVGDLVGGDAGRTVKALGPVLTALMKEDFVGALRGLGVALKGPVGNLISQVAVAYPHIEKKEYKEALGVVLPAVTGLLPPGETRKIVGALGEAVTALVGGKGLDEVLGPVARLLGQEAEGLVKAAGKAFADLKKGENYGQALTGVLGAVAGIISKASGDSGRIGQIVESLIKALDGVRSGDLKAALPRLMPLLGDLVAEFTGNRDAGAAVKGLSTAVSHFLSGGKDAWKRALIAVLPALGTFLGTGKAGVLQELSRALEELFAGTDRKALLKVLTAVAKLADDRIRKAVEGIGRALEDLDRGDVAKGVFNFAGAAFRIASFVASFIPGGEAPARITGAIADLVDAIVTKKAPGEAFDAFVAAVFPEAGEVTTVFKAFLPVVSAILDGKPWQDILEQAVPGIVSVVGYLLGNARIGRVIGSLALPLIDLINGRTEQAVTRAITALADLVDDATGATGTGRLATALAPALISLATGRTEKAITDVLAGIGTWLGGDSTEARVITALGTTVTNILQGRTRDAFAHLVPALATLATDDKSTLDVITHLTPALASLPDGDPAATIPRLLPALATLTDDQPTKNAITHLTPALTSLLHSQPHHHTLAHLLPALAAYTQNPTAEILTPLLVKLLTGKPLTRATVERTLTKLAKTWTQNPTEHTPPADTDTGETETERQETGETETAETDSDVDIAREFDAAIQTALESITAPSGNIELHLTGEINEDTEGTITENLDGTFTEDYTGEETVHKVHVTQLSHIQDEDGTATQTTGTTQHDYTGTFRKQDDGTVEENLDGTITEETTETQPPDTQTTPETATETDFNYTDHPDHLPESENPNKIRRDRIISRLTGASEQILEGTGQVLAGAGQEKELTETLVGRYTKDDPHAVSSPIIAKRTATVVTLTTGSHGVSFRPGGFLYGNYDFAVLTSKERGTRLRLHPEGNSYIIESTGNNYAGYRYWSVNGQDWIDLGTRDKATKFTMDFFGDVEGEGKPFRLRANGKSVYVSSRNSLYIALYGAQNAAQFYLTFDTVVIDSPESGGEVSTTPVFRGRGTPGATVQIGPTSKSWTEAGIATVDQDGNWEYPLTQQLDFGKHTWEARETKDGKTSRRTPVHSFCVTSVAGATMSTGVQVPVTGHSEATVNIPHGKTEVLVQIPASDTSQVWDITITYLQYALMSGAGSPFAPLSERERLGLPGLVTVTGQVASGGQATISLPGVRDIDEAFPPGAGAGVRLSPAVPVGSGQEPREDDGLGTLRTEIRALQTQFTERPVYAVKKTVDAVRKHFEIESTDVLHEDEEDLSTARKDYSADADNAARSLGQREGIFGGPSASVAFDKPGVVYLAASEHLQPDYSGDLQQQQQSLRIQARIGPGRAFRLNDPPTSFLFLPPLSDFKWTTDGFSIKCPPPLSTKGDRLPILALFADKQLIEIVHMDDQWQDLNFDITPSIESGASIIGAIITTKSNPSSLPSNLPVRMLSAYDPSVKLEKIDQKWMDELAAEMSSRTGSGAPFDWRGTGRSADPAIQLFRDLNIEESNHALARAMMRSVEENAAAGGPLGTTAKNLMNSSDRYLAAINDLRPLHAKLHPAKYANGELPTAETVDADLTGVKFPPEYGTRKTKLVAARTAHDRTRALFEVEIARAGVAEGGRVLDKRGWKLEDPNSAWKAAGLVLLTVNLIGSATLAGIVEGDALDQLVAAGSSTAIAVPVLQSTFELMGSTGLADFLGKAGPAVSLVANILSLSNSIRNSDVVAGIFDTFGIIADTVSLLGLKYASFAAAAGPVGFLLAMPGLFYMAYQWLRNWGNQMPLPDQFVQGLGGKVAGKFAEILEDRRADTHQELESIGMSKEGIEAYWNSKEEERYKKEALETLREQIKSANLIKMTETTWIGGTKSAISVANREEIQEDVERMLKLQDGIRGISTYWVPVSVLEELYEGLLEYVTSTIEESPASQHTRLPEESFNAQDWLTKTRKGTTWARKFETERRSAANRTPTPH
ncbi:MULTISPECIES: hypothetical protein [unclassified Streptomyces]|uniref:hypothetical protein n=1 Tax=unclassified Streptomyces TaxID=2593676 RepID=UPI00226E1A81|nr:MULTISPECIES: hypothetical protein [unclassified Streptomyces]MCY0924132.1 hypothetical protein [Streptomyces sp. H27-G5]MCY0963141.1 hypothetical protein [Streptomyces sp. H27-H5]